MFALISPKEASYTGGRVCELAETPFEVAPPLHWMELTEPVIIGEVFFDVSTGTIQRIPPRVGPAAGGSGVIA